MPEAKSATGQCSFFYLSLQRAWRGGLQKREPWPLPAIRRETKAGPGPPDLSKCRPKRAAATRTSWPWHEPPEHLPGTAGQGLAQAFCFCEPVFGAPKLPHALPADSSHGNAFLTSGRVPLLNSPAPGGRLRPQNLIARTVGERESQRDLGVVTSRRLESPEKRQFPKAKIRSQGGGLGAQLYPGEDPGHGLWFSSVPHPRRGQHKCCSSEILAGLLGGGD